MCSTSARTAGRPRAALDLLGKPLVVAGLAVPHVCLHRDRDGVIVERLAGRTATDTAVIL